MKIAVIFGGISTERDISIKSGRAVFNALIELGHEVIGVDPALGSEGFIYDIDEFEKIPKLEALKSNGLYPKQYLASITHPTFDNIDFAFIVLHGKYGEDGTIQSLFEFRGIPYSGSKIKSSSLAIDKNASKMMFSAVGIITPRWTVLKSNDIGNYEIYDELRQEFGKEMVIKPNDQGSTVGVTIIRDGNLDEIHKGCESASKLSDLILIEQYIPGKEITVGILGKEPLPVIEIIPESGFYDFEHKYTKGKTQYVCPAEIPEDISEFAQQLAITAFNALGCSGCGRADFRLDDDGQPFILELNTIPGFTETSLVPKAAKEIGIDFNQLCQKIIDLALANNNGN